MQATIFGGLVEDTYRISVANDSMELFRLYHTLPLFMPYAHWSSLTICCESGNTQLLESMRRPVG
jgi:hypothetical protein